jgi:hypothetical protein
MKAEEAPNPSLFHVKHHRIQTGNLKSEMMLKHRNATSIVSHETTVPQNEARCFT